MGRGTGEVALDLLFVHAVSWGCSRTMGTKDRLGWWLGNCVADWAFPSMGSTKERLKPRTIGPYANLS